IQVASEYVVHAIRWMAATSGQPVDAIGHSQGPLEIRCAIRWWPDLAGLVDDVVSIAGAHHGSTVLDQLCRVPCAAAAWQMRPASNFLAALNAGDETPPGPSWTSIWSQDDGAIMPPDASIQDGAANVRVQDLCPGRSVDHNRLIVDAVVFELVLDALGHEGPADVGRFDATTCAEDLAPGAAPPPGEPDATIETVEFFAIILTSAPLLIEEPALAGYATTAPGAEPVKPSPVSAENASSLPETGATGAVACGLLLSLSARSLQSRSRWKIGRSVA
ncbi:MAG: hypothetical protein R3249_06045, partial [Nitriliruptorales bacterium]|nr:hypothetical protein [Nitriliruptorales bacterium]